MSLIIDLINALPQLHVTAQFFLSLFLLQEILERQKIISFKF